jgi:carboxylesterase type B
MSVYLVGFFKKRAEMLMKQDTAGYYNFSNIRYAQAPVGDLRFAPPQAPLPNRTVDDGQVGRICYQASPAWEAISQGFLDDFLTGQSISNYSTLPSGPSTPPPQDPRSTEDCLFLDVIVPQNVYNNGSGKAPVIVWIYGGGYTAGEKAGDAQPAGLVAKSENVTGSDGAVFVALNYRVSVAMS